MPKVFKRAGQIRRSAATAALATPGPDLTASHPYLVPVASLPKVRKPYGFKEAVIGPEGLVYGPGGVFSHSTQPSMQPSEYAPGGTILLEENMDVGDLQRANKNQRQWQKWSEEVIPALLKPYLHLLHETTGLRNMNNAKRDDLCAGCGQGRLFDVSCIFFESKCPINLLQIFI
jgi:hypothetical protein